MSPTPSSPDALALVRQGWDHLRLRRPLAAWASWQQALRLEPGDRAASQALESLASAPDLPAAARASYRFRQPRDEPTRRRWDEALRGRDLRQLPDAASAFADLVDAEPSDAAARYNHALALAWLGRNAPAIAALDAAVRLDAAEHPDAASEAWTLAAILRQGAGAEGQADDFDHALIVPWGPRDPDPASLAPPGTVRPVALPPDAPTAGVRVFEWLDRPMPGPSEVSRLDDLPAVLATVVHAADSLRFSSPRAERLRRIEELAHDALPAEGHLDRRSTPLPLSLLDAAVWAFRMPPGLDPPTQARLTREAVEQYYEYDWIVRPLTSLADVGSTPAAASRRADQGDPTARARLSAAVRLREQLGERPNVAALYAGYPFDRLRSRLGLDPLDPAALDASDPSCLGPSQLRALDPSALETSALADAHRSARLFGDDDLADRLADELAARNEDRPT